MLVKSDIRQNKKYQYWIKQQLHFFLLVYMLLKNSLRPVEFGFEKKEEKKKKEKKGKEIRISGEGWCHPFRCWTLWEVGPRW